MPTHAHINIVDTTDINPTKSADLRVFIPKWYQNHLPTAKASALLYDWA
jgi:hypothetical protein